MPIKPTHSIRIKRPGTAIAILCAAIYGTANANNQVLDEDTQIMLPEGFDAELLYSVPKSQGSWVAMAFDPKGRIIVSDQDSKGVFRVTLPKEGDAASTTAVESLKGFPYEPIPWGQRTVGGALGFIHAFDSLYMTTMTGFYRIRDTDGDDQYDEFKLLKKLQMGYEHSAHSIIVSEDGKALYLISGNFGTLPKGIASLQPRVWKEDTLLTSMPDPMGHAVGLKAPGGWICRISPDGSDWKMISSGFRNCVDLALNREGELFTYDSDMEFDIGCPWYRPTRINHVTSASEFGWRAGTAIWSDYFADSNGSVLDVGPGSPTAMSFGHHSNFPSQYQDKLFICDWTFGTIYTVDMEESGSSYVGTKTEFLNGTPLNIAAMRFAPDGNMYFVTGGRNTDSKLYRVRHKGHAEPGPVKTLTKNQGIRDLRHSLERYHGNAGFGQEAVDAAWPHLADEDRDIRYAARLAIENQAVALWQDRALMEKDPRSAIYAIIALCRNGDKALTSQILNKLNGIDFKGLGTSDRLALLRAYSLCFIRMNSASPTEVQQVVANLDRFFPAQDEALNTELCRVLSYLEGPDVVRKTIGLMKTTQAKTVKYDEKMLSRHEYGKVILDSMANSPNAQNIQYAYSLRRVTKGWSLEDRKFYFSWLNETLSKSGGRSFSGYIRSIRQDAIDQLNPEAASEVAWLLGDVATTDLSQLPSPKGPGVAWTNDSALKLFETPLTGRNHENGKTMFAAGRCIACHRIEGLGGYTGPDLGSVGSRYSVADILMSTIEPSQSISEQYHANSITLKDGTSLYGRMIDKTETEIVIAPSAFMPGTTQKIAAGDVAKIELSQVSMMPPGMINGMNGEELKDLVAYLISGGDKNHKVFQK